jgi:putative MFS transporter
VLAEHVGWGAAVASTTLFAFGAFVLLWLWLPETKGRELEETARV